MTFPDEWVALAEKAESGKPFAVAPLDDAEFRLFRTPEFQEFYRWYLDDCATSAAAAAARPLSFDRDDIEALFRFLMQLARHLAKKYDFKIKQWPES